ncbi:hypothetical protein GCK32_019670, partial [Trichostrongylus colubriformis]
RNLNVIPRTPFDCMFHLSQAKPAAILPVISTPFVFTLRHSHHRSPPFSPLGIRLRKIFIGNLHEEKTMKQLPNSHIGRGGSQKNPPSYKMSGYDSDQEQKTSIMLRLLSAGPLLEVNKCMQKACLELKTISGQIKIMRKRMEEDERVIELFFLFLPYIRTRTIPSYPIKPADEFTE